MSIASRITSIEGHISDIYDSVELTGVDTTDIDKNLVNVPNTLKEGYIDIINNGTDTLYNNFPKVSGEGTSLTLNNTYQAPMRNNLKGNTSQTGTPTPTSPIPVNVVSGDNEILVNGKNLFDKSSALLNKMAQGNGNIIDYTGIFSSDYIKVQPSTSYYVNQYAPVPIEYDKNKNVIGYSTGGNSAYAKTFTTSSNCQYVRIRMFDTTYSMDTALNNAMLSLGTTSTTYEPYQGDTYNIDLPQGMELCKIGNYQDKFLRSNGTNLAPNNLSSETYNSLQITNNNNGTFTLLGNPTGSFGRDIATNLTLKAGTYTISANEMPSGLYIALDNEADTQLSNGTLSKTFTLASDTTYTSLGIWFTKNKDYDVTIKLMINEGSSALLWQPKNGWYLHKEIGKKTLIASDVNSRGTTGTNAYYLATNVITLNDNTTALCMTSMFNSVSFNNRADGNYNIYSQNGYLNLRTGNNTNIDWSTLENAKQWVTDNAPIVYYVLATPTSTEITDTTLINQLEEFYQAQSKNNQTNISQINNDLGFIISASALKKG